MGFEPGGRAGKLGNRYEGHWVAKQLLRVLDEQIRSVTVEAVGDDERGVDLWVELKDGRRQAQQCKARNRGRASWSIADLCAQGVLSSLQYQLDRAPDVEFALVSGVPATEMRDICDSARNSSDPESFFEHQLGAEGSPRRKVVERFCRALGLDLHAQRDRAQAHDYLCRTRIIHFADDDDSWDDLLTQARHMLTGAPESVIATLCSYVEDTDHLGKAIYPDALQAYLQSLGIYPRNLAHDRRVVQVIQRLQSEFEDSLAPRLIGGSLIPRQETDKCIEAMRTQPLVVLHGAAGCGKSGVLHELVCRLRDANAPFLPLRLDRRIPHGNAAEYGRDIGLPESPVHCLVALAGDRPCVLVLDQLDAIRWTSSHSADAMEVCRELLREAVSFRREGRDIKVILACRTYDLENDPQIRSLLSHQQARVEVGPLSQQVVSSIAGPEYGDLTERQRRILANPQNLSMWAEMRQGETRPVFESATELMRRFWEFKNGELEREGIAPEHTQELLDRLVERMDRDGTISAPDWVVSPCFQRALAALQSHGILQARGRRLSFAHQSYLDHLIAMRVLRTIDQGGAVLDWLGPRERQTLLRREQLRQVLALLESESPRRFLSEAQSILAADGVRFHLKHLVLEVIGQIDDPGETLAAWCTGLLDDHRWRPHALSTVFLGHEPYVRLLAERGVLGRWLESCEQEEQDWALKLLASVVDKLPDLVPALLWPLASRGGDWPERVLRVIGWDAAVDPDALFDLRLHLASRGVVHDFVAWAELCSKHPMRALKLIGAYMSTLTNIDEARLAFQQRRPIDRPTRADAAALREVGRRYPLQTWELLMPHFFRLATATEPHSRATIASWHGYRSGHSGSADIPLAWVAVDMVAEAGRSLAQTAPLEFLQRSKSLDGSGSRLMERILAEAYACLPPVYADAGVEWLLRDLGRLSLGDGIEEATWMPAARVIQALSPHITPNLFRELEGTLIHYRDPDERPRAKPRLQSWRSGHFIPYWGREQYVLLPALCPERRGALTNRLIECLEKRFRGRPEMVFPQVAVKCGWVGSKLDAHLDRISDKSWVGIVANKRLLPENHRTWQQVDEDHLVESSISQFAGSLRRIASRFPERFGRLALRFPLDVDAAYVSAILDTVRLTRPDPAAGTETPDDWQPASTETVIAVIERFADTTDREVALSFCQLVRDRAEEEWPNTAIARLMSYAREHPDPGPNMLNIHSDQPADRATVDALFQNAINCVRGVAAEAIGQLLWHQSDLLEVLRPAIDSLVADRHPAVRMAAVRALLPVLNIDRDQAVEWFCQACSDDLRIAASPHAVNFFNWTIKAYFPQLGPIVRRMISSSQPDVVEQGAQAVTAYWLFHGLFDQELTDCREGSPEQRRAVAEVAASWIATPEYADRCADLLKPLMDDPAKEVRAATSLMWSTWRGHFIPSDANLALARTYVSSRAFAEEPSRFIDFLKERRESLVPMSGVVLQACESLAIGLKQGVAVWDPLWDGTTSMLPLLLRLYEETAERRPEIADRCLDTWDLLLERGVAMARQLTRALDA